MSLRESKKSIQFPDDPHDLFKFFQNKNGNLFSDYEIVYVTIENYKKMKDKMPRMELKMPIMKLEYEHMLFRDNKIEKKGISARKMNKTASDLTCEIDSLSNDE
jgi:hypothetical protein